MKLHVAGNSEVKQTRNAAAVRSADRDDHVYYGDDNYYGAVMGAAAPWLLLPLVLDVAVLKFNKC